MAVVDFEPDTELCETMKHWRRHNPEVTFPDSLYEQLENIQDKCTKAIQVYGKSV